MYKSTFRMLMESGIYNNMYPYDYVYENATASVAERGSKLLGKTLDDLTTKAGKKAYKDLDGGVLSHSFAGKEKDITSDINYMLRGTDIHFERPKGMSDKELEEALKAADEISPLLRFEKLMTYPGIREAMAKAGAKNKDEFRDMLKYSKLSDEATEAICDVIVNELMRKGKYEEAKKMKGLNLKTNDTILGTIAMGLVSGAAIMVVMGGVGYIMDKRKEDREYEMIYGRKRD